MVMWYKFICVVVEPSLGLLVSVVSNYLVVGNYTY